MESMKTLNKIFIGLLLGSVLSSCEQEFTPDIKESPDQIVVEGRIEAGENILPPYVILTKSIPFFSILDPDQLDELFIKNAEVSVKVDGKVYPFTELCLNDLTAEQKELFAAALNINLDSTSINFCVYIDLSFQLIGEIGKSYDLLVKTDQKILTATTTIPHFIPLDSFIFVQPPGQSSDTLRQLQVYITDIPNEANFYRYFTSINAGPFIPGFQSVEDDKFFDGLQFKFPLPKGEPVNGGFNPVSFGLYRVGTNVRIKWTTIDKAHFDYWNTLEFNRNNQGPFSSYTRVKSNINGGLGIWGGYAVSEYKIEVK